MCFLMRDSDEYDDKFVPIIRLGRLRYYARYLCTYIVVDKINIYVLLMKWEQLHIILHVTVHLNLLHGKTFIAYLTNMTLSPVNVKSNVRTYLKIYPNIPVLH